MAGPRDVAIIIEDSPSLQCKAEPNENQAITQIQQYGLFMERNGRAYETRVTRIRALKRMAKKVDLTDTEKTKEVIARQQWSTNTKRNFAKVYNNYLDFLGIKWKRPDYKYQQPIPFIPTETEIDQLIAANRVTVAALLQFLKETGARIGEAKLLQWTDIDTERKTVHIKAIKGSNPRILPISSKLIGMTELLPKKSDKVFPTQKHAYRTTLSRVRQLVAKRTSNPRILQIHFHTLRHWKGTMEYHKTKDILHVKQILGHKDIESTMVYINIEQALFLQDSDEWICRAAKTIDEATKLIEAGFQYVTTIEGIQLFKKRK